MTAMVFRAACAVLVIIARACVALDGALGIGAGRCIGHIEREDSDERDAKHRDPASPVEVGSVQHESLFTLVTLTNG